MNGLESVDIGCPYCGEPSEILIDCSVPEQSYVEDCEVCCRPIEIDVVLDDNGPSVTTSREDDA